MSMSFEEMESKLLSMEKLLEKALYEAERAKAYGEIQKVWATHAYCYSAEEQRFELDHFWAKEHDDIMYSHGPYAYVGRDLVYEYYAAGNEKMNAGKLKLMHALYPDQIADIPENLGIGDMVINIQSTPYIEIAKDNKTAKGIFYNVHFQSEIDLEGQPTAAKHAGWNLQKDVVDFVKESDGWKIWHFAASPEVGGNLDINVQGRMHAAPPPEDVEAGEDKKPRHGRTIPGTFPKMNRVIEPLPYQDTYSAMRVAQFSPKLPMPYETWDESMSLAKPMEDEEHAEELRKISPF